MSRSSLLTDPSYRVMPPEKPKRPEEFTGRISFVFYMNFNSLILLVLILLLIFMHGIIKKCIMSYW